MKIHLTKKELKAAVVAGIGTQVPFRDADVEFEVIDYGASVAADLRYEVRAVVSLAVKGED